MLSVKILPNHTSQLTLLSLKQTFVNKMESIKVKEEELVECLLQLQAAEGEYTNRNRKLEELQAVLAGTYKALSN